MSFDIFFVRSKFRNEMVEWKNPYTGEVKSIRPQEPLTESELHAVRAVLHEAGAPEPNEHDHSAIKFSDGGVAEVYTGDLEKGCCVTPRLGLSPDCLRFLVDLLNAAEWVMFPAMTGNPAIVSSPGIANEFADRFTEVVCTSPEELGAVLADGSDD